MPLSLDGTCSRPGATAATLVSLVGWCRRALRRRGEVARSVSASLSHSRTEVREERRTSMREFLAIVMALALAGESLLAPATSSAQSKGEIVIGVQCDRSGATQIIGSVLCPGFHDYIALINSKGGIDGYKLKALEVDHEYKVPPA